MIEIMKGNPFPIGCTVYDAYVNFSVAAEKGSECKLLFFGQDKDEPEMVVSMPEESGMGNLRCISVLLDEIQGDKYIYQIDGEFVTDPYAKIVDVQGFSSIVSDPFDWENDKLPSLNDSDVVAYALHVKGFTRHESSGVIAKGKFLGIIEKIEYFKSLGVNQLHLMPVYDFADEVQGRTNYWGFGLGNYFAPKKAYSIFNPVTECKEMVKMLHKSGIEVILEMPFDSGVPQSLMLDALRYWKMEYHVDGFIVNPYSTNWEMLVSDPILAGTKILRRQDEFQNVMRRFMKSDAGMISPVMWWSKQVNAKDGYYNYITSHNGFTLKDLVSYNEKHNEDNGELGFDGTEYNYSWNCGAEGDSDNDEVLELRKKQMRNAMYLLLLSQGIPCILSGDEFGNSQFGNNNPYCQDNEISWLDWNLLEDNRKFFEFVKALISLRKSFSAFHPEKGPECGINGSHGIPQISYHGEEAWKVDLDEENRSFSIFYHNEEKLEEFLLVVYNMHWEMRTFALPSLPEQKKWYEIASTESGVASSEYPENWNVVEAWSREIRVFIGK